jgi:transposase-like protein
MSAKGFRNLLQYISTLDKPHQERIYYELQRSIFPSSASTHVINELRDKRYAKGFTCAHCKSCSVVRFGKYSGWQRYKCKDCGKTFSDLTNSPLQGTHYPEKWIKFIDCMLKGMSLREASNELGVHHVTLFYWRHKVLSALEQKQIEQFEGILEVDETYFLFSEKGKKNMRDRKARKRGGVSQFRGISKEQVCVFLVVTETKIRFPKWVVLKKLKWKKSLVALFLLIQSSVQMVGGAIKHTQKKRDMSIIGLTRKRQGMSLKDYTIFKM